MDRFGAVVLGGFIAGDRRELRQDRRELRQDRRELQRDRCELRRILKKESRGTSFDPSGLLAGLVGGRPPGFPP